MSDAGVRAERVCCCCCCWRGNGHGTCIPPRQRAPGHAASTIWLREAASVSGAGRARACCNRCECRACRRATVLVELEASPRGLEAELAAAGGTLEGHAAEYDAIGALLAGLLAGAAQQEDPAVVAVLGYLSLCSASLAAAEAGLGQGGEEVVFPFTREALARWAAGCGACRHPACRRHAHCCSCPQLPRAPERRPVPGWVGRPGAVGGAAWRCAGAARRAEATACCRRPQPGPGAACL
jgi:hypothetical protein